jgi:hypothetical protein
MANSATRFGTLLAFGGGSLGAGVIAAALVGSVITGGDFIFDTKENPTPSVVVDTTDVMTMSGTDAVEFNVPTLQPLNGVLALVEADGVAGGSGTQVITNPFDDYLICDTFSIYVSTTASPAMSADIYTSTGATVAVTGSGVNIADNYRFPTGLKTFTGSALTLGSTAASGIGPFILAPSSSTTEAKSIVIKSKSGTGAGLVGLYDAPCRLMNK